MMSGEFKSSNIHNDSRLKIVFRLPAELVQQFLATKIQKVSSVSILESPGSNRHPNGEDIDMQDVQTQESAFAVPPASESSSKAVQASKEATGFGAHTGATSPTNPDVEMPNAQVPARTNEHTHENHSREEEWGAGIGDLSGASRPNMEDAACTGSSSTVTPLGSAAQPATTNTSEEVPGSQAAAISDAEEDDAEYDIEQICDVSQDANVSDYFTVSYFHFTQ
jgi:hypothetical protein